MVMVAHPVPNVLVRTSCSRSTARAHVRGRRLASNDVVAVMVEVKTILITPATQCEVRILGSPPLTIPGQRDLHLHP